MPMPKSSSLGRFAREKTYGRSTEPANCGVGGYAYGYGTPYTTSSCVNLVSSRTLGCPREASGLPTRDCRAEIGGVSIHTYVDIDACVHISSIPAYDFELGLIGVDTARLQLFLLFLHLTAHPS